MTAPRVALSGIVAAPGIALGRARLLDADHPLVARRRVPPEALDHEVVRLRQAIEAARAELERIRDQLGQDAPAGYRLLLDAHLMMHGDELLIDATIERIRNEQINAEWAVERSVAAIAERLLSSGYAYFQGRALDIDHLGRRIQRQLAGRDSSLPPVEPGTIWVARDLHPADAAQLLKFRVEALVTALGTATSHIGILARALDIPAVVGVMDANARIGSGEQLVVDALRGEVVVGPSDEERERAEARAVRYRRFTVRLREQHRAHTASADGVAVQLTVNAELPEEAKLAADEGVGGIGLFRTEYLFLGRTASAGEDEQTEVYSRIVRSLGGRPVVFRTNDAGGDALSISARPVSSPPNPALGLRALRLGFAYPAVLRAQLRAILRAAAAGPVSLLLPMVSGVGELRRARAMLDEARRDLDARGTPHGPVQVGVMIELPSSVMMADRLAEACDFFAVGTNDLVQYTLAVDRSNPSVAYLASSLDPAVLRLLDRAAKIARARSLPISLCGDMSSDPVALPIVLGLGFRSLSVPLGSLPLVREAISRIDTGRAQEAACDALEQATADEVRCLVGQRFSTVLGDLWAEQGIELPERAIMEIA